MIVMIDLGTTHNSISLGAVAALGIPEGFGVALGNGEAIHGKECVVESPCTWMEDWK